MIYSIATPVYVLLCCACTALAVQARAQEHVTLHEEKTAQGVTLFLENHWLCPYTVDFNAILTNAKASRSLPVRVVVPANSRIELLQITPQPHSRWSYKVSFSYTLGDVLHARHDAQYVYQLPFEQGQSFVLWQGYHGAFSHQGQKALDFNMPEGTLVCAAREGIVVEVKNDSNEGCRSPACKSKANYAIIHHTDGSMATYAHFRHQGVVVKPGDTVQKGQIIGYSGNTGWSSGPHLHFEVWVPEANGERKTVPTYFKTASGAKILLEEKQAYSW